MSRVARKAGAHFRKVAKLQAMGAAGRAELRRMREVWYDTDKAVSPGAMFNPEGKQFVRGSEGKARNIQRGHTARNNQGKGI